MKEHDAKKANRIPDEYKDPLEYDPKKANRIPDEYKDPLEYARECARIPDEYIDRYKSVHNPDTYQQTYQDRLRRVRLSIEKRLLYKKKNPDATATKSKYERFEHPARIFKRFLSQSLFPDRAYYFLPTPKLPV